MLTWDPTDLRDGERGIERSKDIGRDEVENAGPRSKTQGSGGTFPFQLVFSGRNRVVSVLDLYVHVWAFVFRESVEPVTLFDLPKFR